MMFWQERDNSTMFHENLTEIDFRSIIALSDVPIADWKCLSRVNLPNHLLPSY
jgi:hypothetical protein